MQATTSLICCCFTLFNNIFYFLFIILGLPFLLISNGFRGRTWTNSYRNMDKLIPKHGQTHTVTWTNSYRNMDKLIPQHGQTHTVIWTNSYRNMDNKFIMSIHEGNEYAYFYVYLHLKILLRCTHSCFY